MTPNIQSFIAWEKASRDTIDVKKVYIDIAGSLAAGVLLSQIVYWHLPNRDGSSKLVVLQENELWLVKQREDWWEECRLTENEYDYAIKLLVKSGVIIKKIFKSISHKGSTITHLRLDWDKLEKKVRELLNPMENSKKDSRIPDFPNHDSENQPCLLIYNKETTLEQEIEQEQSASAGTTPHTKEKIFVSSDLDGNDLQKGTLRMPQEKWDAYVKQHGEARVNRCATELSNYIVKTGTKYKSHYLALASFIKNSIEKEKSKPSNAKKDFRYFPGNYTMERPPETETY